MEHQFDRIKLNDGMIVTISDDRTIIKTEVNGRTYGFDVNKATEKEISDFMAGVGYGRAVSSNITLSNNQQEQNQSNSFQNNGLERSNNMSAGNQDASSKTKTLTNGHYKGNNDIDNKISTPFQNPNGYINKILVTCLSGFMFGVIIATIYIFINLGKITYTL